MLAKLWRKRKQPHPAILYKFFGPERADTLASCRVRFSQTAALNDPFEFATTLKAEMLELAAVRYAKRQFTPWGIAYQGTATGLKTVWKHERLQRMLPIKLVLAVLVALIVPVLCIAIYPFVRRQALSVMAAAGSDMGAVVSRLKDGMIVIFSTSERWDSVPMWAHYASNHTGFCIGIDPTNAFQGQSKSGPRPLLPRRVVYSSKTPTVRVGTFEIDDFLVSKMDHWAYEHEWRFLGLPDDASAVLRETGGREILLFDLNPEAIKDITFGARASYSLMSEIIGLLAARGIAPELYKISDDTGYGFRRVPIDDFLASPSETRRERDVPRLSELRLNKLEQAMRDMENAAHSHPILGKARRKT